MLPDHFGSQEARAILAKLAGGSWTALETQKARAVADRLARRLRAAR